MKPHHGDIVNWSRSECDGGLGYFIYGGFVSHPEFAGVHTNTSYVVAHDSLTGEIVTKNSRYRLVGSERKAS